MYCLPFVMTRQAQLKTQLFFSKNFNISPHILDDYSIKDVYDMMQIIEKTSKEADINNK